MSADLIEGTLCWIVHIPGLVPALVYDEVNLVVLIMIEYHQVGLQIFGPPPGVDEAMFQ
jgi:hypothetical protein